MRQLPLFATQDPPVTPPPPATSARQAADAAQRLAADPRASIWVGASAGTGKTKVLTDRTLSLMLAGVAPHRILCLTFTKAAAAEMASRIALQLGLWAKAPAAELNDALASLLGRAPDDSERSRARRLFPAVLDTPGGLNVLTIHAFCQSLLGRFPLEAGVAPHFKVMDERDSREALAGVLETILAEAHGGSGPIAAAFAEIMGQIKEQSFRGLIDGLVAARGRLARCLEHFGSPDATVAALRDHLGLGGEDTAARVLADACRDGAFDGPALRAAARALALGSPKDQDRSETIAAWLAADASDRAARFAAYRCAFLTKKGEIQKTLITKACGKGAPEALAVLCAEAERVLASDMRHRAAACADTTAAVVSFAERLLAAYRHYKDTRALLDYDDLIVRAADLLERDGGAAWVLFKLDGGIDHVLIDEAQDTSAEQWRVVRALTAEFFAGDGREQCRTVFAVGDIKQSIFSFQGANPALFLTNGDWFAERAQAVKQPWRPVHLTVSFRSTKAVLAAVDAVFAGDDARDGVALDGAPIRHSVSDKRAGDGGSVEVWPPINARPDDAPEPWRPPVERVRGDAPQRRLAAVIARRIREMIRGGTDLDSKARPPRPEDILVLVRRRTGFVEDLVRALKSHDIPVAGVDRMMLSEQIAVMDLIALGRFALLPDDDLNLASVLKGPIIGFDDDDLFALAYGRAGALWPEVRRRREERPRFTDAYALLSRILRAADAMPPYEFYSLILGPLGGRRRLLGRLGQDADDPVAEFIDLALVYERNHPPSLEGFLHWLTMSDVVIKRDLEQSQGAVRIMTVHGAKGLQAPIVFLPDTMQVPLTRANLFWPAVGREQIEVPLWAPPAERRDDVARRERERLADEEMREYRRLLYVAMTRAEDRLIVCGWRGKKAEPDTCWYNTIRRGLDRAQDGVAAEVYEDAGLAADPDFDAEAKVLRMRCPQSAAIERPAVEGQAFVPPLPECATTPALPEAEAAVPLAPSRADGAAGPICSPGAGESHGLKRGRLIHGLLQWLPEIAPARRRAAADAWLARPAHQLAPEARAEMAEEVLAVINHPEHAALFALGSLAEVPLSGMVGTRFMTAQVDRLVVTGDSVTVVDYKTDRPAPAMPADTAPRYLAQMAAYRAALELIYPGHAVVCALLWTAGPRLMVLPDDLLDRHAP